VIRYYYPEGVARKCGSQIPAGAPIEVVKFLLRRGGQSWNTGAGVT